MSFFTTENNTKTEINRTDIRISYASQDPWIFAASIRDNITLGQPYDKDRYQEITRVCALVEDFEQLPQGDLTYAGEKGATLSGGQKARVNLARALYRDADLYLLDDPLSAVDSKVGNHLFKECIQGFLRDKTRILVTHQLQFLREADSVIVIHLGSVKYQGTYEELPHSGLNLLDTVKLEEFDAPKEDEEILEKTAEDRELAAVVNDEDESSELPEGTQTLSLDVQQEEELAAVVNDEDEPSELPEGTQTLSLDVQQEEELAAVVNDKDKPSELPEGTQTLSLDVKQGKVPTGKKSNHKYKSYISACGDICTLIIVTAAFVITQALDNASDYWIAYWTNHISQRTNFTLYNEFSTTSTTQWNSISDNQEQKYWTDDFDCFQLQPLYRNLSDIYVSSLPYREDFKPILKGHWNYGQEAAQSDSWRTSHLHRNIGHNHNDRYR
ncbi:ATP-binding cassette sub-family C member 4-like [Neodiprion lecontei]|uniref:ATP-binding cassette sub-family C member 4-like n=1 Tax=Neodiprion lecontei TaxID=441921 RepID=A0ABM3GBB5_NEOLC|nr:ATP-binding cassette sub-family C member 4-like [Neodiprion lecontei]